MNAFIKYIIVKIFFISTMAGAVWGGSEELWSQTALHLKRLGHEVEVTICSIQAPERPKRLDQLIAAGIKFRVASFQTTTFSIINNAVRRKLGRFLPFLISKDQTIDWMLQGKPDLVVFSDGTNSGNMDWFKACLDHEIPYVTIAQAVNEVFWPDDFVAERLRGALQSARECFFVSQANLETTRLQVGLQGENFNVVRNPFNVDYDTVLPWPNESKTFQMAFVGRLEPGAKGCDLLLQAMSNSIWHSRNIELHFYGSGTSAQGVRAMAEILGIKNCFFHGHVANVTEVWQQHHLLVLPSRYEGLPLAVVEAMLCGRPCLVTDVSGNAELIENGTTGFVAAGASVASLGATLEKAWEARHNWKAMGAAAAISVRSQIPRDPAGELAKYLLSY
jgi:glycosyltransferase involved in cell wall biosynthesis